MKMKKFKVNQTGMTLVEVLVAMTLFTIMFMMIFGIMYASVRMNADTRTYDLETDVQIEDLEKFNPMGASVDIDGVIPSTGVSNYDIENGDNKYTLQFQFPNQTITVEGNAYQVDSKNENNGFRLKFFDSTAPKVEKGEYWIRIFNVSSEPDKKVCFYLPDGAESFLYLKYQSEPYTRSVTKVVPLNTVLGVGYVNKNNESIFFYVSDVEGIPKENVSTISTVVQLENLLEYDEEKDGYIDIYYTDDGFKGLQEYKEYLANPGP